MLCYVMLFNGMEWNGMEWNVMYACMDDNVYMYVYI